MTKPTNLGHSLVVSYITRPWLYKDLPAHEHCATAEAMRRRAGIPPQGARMASNIGRTGVYTEYWGWTARVQVIVEKIQDGWLEVVLEIVAIEKDMSDKYDKKVGDKISASKCLTSTAKTWELVYDDEVAA